MPDHFLHNNHKFEYDRYQRGSTPLTGKSSTLLECYNHSLKDFIGSQDTTVLVACVCSEDEIWNSVAKYIADDIGEVPHIPPLSPLFEWSTYLNDAGYHMSYCTNNPQRYIYDGDYDTCCFTAPDISASQVFKVAFVQGIAPLFLHHGIPPTDKDFKNTKSLFFRMRQNEEDDQEDFETACENIDALLSKIRIGNCKLRLIIHFPENSFSELCDVITRNSSPAINRVVRIVPTDVQKWIDNIEKHPELLTDDLIQRLIRIVELAKMDWKLDHHTLEKLKEYPIEILYLLQKQDELFIEADTKTNTI